MSKIDRENNYDALRVFATLSVIIMHINWQFFKSKVYFPSWQLNYVIESSLNILTRFSVPCFFMLSGAFTLKYFSNTKDVIDFYVKSVKKIFFPTLIVLVIYGVIDVIIDKGELQKNIIEIFRGSKYNLWYMYTLFVIYLFSPLVSCIKKSIPKQIYPIFVWMFLLWAIISQIFSNHNLAYDNGVVVSFLSYFIVGNYLYENSNKIKNRVSINMFIILIMYLVTFFCRWGGVNIFLSSPYVSFFSPTITVMSICIFSIATCMGKKIKFKFYKISKYTFYIYLFHTPVFIILLKIIKVKGELIRIIIISMLTFCIAFIVGMVFEKLWSKLVGRDNIKIWLNTFVEGVNEQKITKG